MFLPYPGIVGFVYSFGAQFTAPLCYVKTCGQPSEIGSLSNYTRFPCILLLFLNQGFLVYVILYCPFIPIKGFVCNYSILATIQLWKISTNHPKLTWYHYSRFPQYCELWLVSFSFCPFKQGFSIFCYSISSSPFIKGFVCNSCRYNNDKYTQFPQNEQLYIKGSDFNHSIASRTVLYKRG